MIMLKIAWSFTGHLIWRDHQTGVNNVHKLYIKQVIKKLQTSSVKWQSLWYHRWQWDTGKSYLQCLVTTLEKMPFHHCTRALFPEGTGSEQSRYTPGLGKCKTAHHSDNLPTNWITIMIRKIIPYRYILKQKRTKKITQQQQQRDSNYRKNNVLMTK